MRRRVRPVRRIRAVTRQAQIVRRLDQIRVVRSAVNVVTTEARHSPRVHQALDEVVALHPVLVRGAICKVREGRLPELVLFQLPEILESTPT